MQELFREIEIKMRDAAKHLHEDFKTLRTGRANASLLDGVMVDYYGTPTPLRQLSNLNVLDAATIVAQPYDPTQIAAIERAIRTSDLGLNPTNDGKLIRIPVPPPTAERRKELVKRAHDLTEGSRNAVRQARRDGNERLKKMEKDKKVSQDDFKRGHDEIQKLHDHYIVEINKALEAKEKDILEV